MLAVAGSKHKQYVFDGKRIRAVDPEVLRYGETRHDRVSAIVSRLRGNVFDAFFPPSSEVRARDLGSALEAETL